MDEHNILYSLEWLHPKETIVLHYIYFRYLHKLNVIVFTMLSAIKLVKFSLCSPIIDRVICFDCAVYFEDDEYCKQCASAVEYIISPSWLIAVIMVLEI